MSSLNAVVQSLSNKILSLADVLASFFSIFIRASSVPSLLAAMGSMVSLEVMPLDGDLSVVGLLKPFKSLMMFKSSGRVFLT